MNFLFHFAEVKSEKCLVVRIQLQPHVHHPPQDPMEITRVRTLYPKIKIIQGRSNTYPKNDRYCKIHPMNQMKRTLIEKILTVCRIPIQKETLKTNRESSSRKKTTANSRKNNSAILKLGLLIMLRDGYTYRKSKKDSQIKQIRRRKRQFLFPICVKNH